MGRPGTHTAAFSEAGDQFACRNTLVSPSRHRFNRPPMPIIRAPRGGSFTAAALHVGESDSARWSTVPARACLFPSSASIPIRASFPFAAAPARRTLPLLQLGPIFSTLHCGRIMLSPTISSTIVKMSKYRACCVLSMPWLVGPFCSAPFTAVDCLVGLLPALCPGLAPQSCIRGWPFVDSQGLSHIRVRGAVGSSTLHAASAVDTRSAAPPPPAHEYPVGCGQFHKTDGRQLSSVKAPPPQLLTKTRSKSAGTIVDFYSGNRCVTPICAADGYEGGSLCNRRHESGQR